jgi:hypothetical protein
MLCMWYVLCIVCYVLCIVYYIYEIKKYNALSFIVIWPMDHVP